ncbi:hypothetical protein AAIA72_03080 [Hahella sp. SMD15-11]|uniref:Phenylacetate--CoA ligase family protein n=1 Tax=Thermohahella caldifontis TaxID=3142973 RepID=A0AB39UXD7_9GAMM
MNKWAESLYYRSPVWLQNILVSLYGLKLVRERYAPGSDHVLQSLCDKEFAPADTVRAEVDAAFRTLAREAIRDVPYYRKWAKREGVREQDIQGLDDLKRFPVLDKKTVKANPLDFVSERFPLRSLFRLNTSGTTGTPLDIYTNAEYRTLHYAFFSRLRRHYGLTKHSRRATFFGRIIMPAAASKPPFWRYDRPQRNLLCSSYHLSEAHLPHYARKLEQFWPDEIIGYPSSLYVLARFLVNHPEYSVNPKVVFTTSETLFDHQRETIARAFRAPVVNQYGCTEMAFFASEYECGKLHVHPEHGWLECTDVGELLATGFVNRVMPLIRYKVGDSGEVVTTFEKCSCGHAWPVIEHLIGRTDDILYKADGTPVGRLDPVFKGGQGILEAQVIQTGQGRFTVNVVPDGEFSEAERNHLLNELQKRLGDDAVISIELLESIPRGNNGKFRAVINDNRE